MTAGLREAGWGWADHLRSGGTTPWLRWLDQQPDLAGAEAGAGTADRGRLPGAAQLELVRRLAARSAAPAGGPAFAALADLALARSGPGRGPARLPLLWPPETAGRRHGPPPTDPARVPPEELVRLGVGLLAELLLRSGRPDAAPPGRARHRRPWHKSFHVAGAPVTVAQVRAGLAAAGHVQGGRRPEVVVLAEPLDAVVAQVWSRRVQDGDPVRWATFLRRWARRDAVPPAADLADTARFWADRAGPSRVHVVTGPRLRRTAVEVLGLATAEPPAAAPLAPRSLSPEAVDLLRRLNRVLGVRAAEDERGDHLRRATALLPVTPEPVLAVPPRFRGWLDEHAAAVTDAIRAGGYAVHGDLARIAPRHDGATHPRRPDVLALVLDTCLRAAGPTT